MFKAQSIEVALSLVCTDKLKQKVKNIQDEIDRISPNFVCDARAILAGSIPTTSKGAVNPLDKDETLIRTNLNVSFNDKDEAKTLGARWCPLSKTWYCIGDTSKFSKWLNTVNKKAESKTSRYMLTNKRRYK
jgi:hypothetical protein